MSAEPPSSELTTEQWEQKLAQLRATNEELQRRRLEAEKDRDLFRELYGKASAHASSVSAENNTLAERAAWDFWNGHKSEVGWDLVVLNPPFVFGPFLHDVDKPENLNESAREFYDTVVKGTKDNNTLANVGYEFWFPPSAAH